VGVVGFCECCGCLRSGMERIWWSAVFVVANSVVQQCFRRPVLRLFVVFMPSWSMTTST
jgi:hypothetical protein